MTNSSCEGCKTPKKWKRLCSVCTRKLSPEYQDYFLAEPAEEKPCEHGWTGDSLYCYKCGMTRATTTEEKPKEIEKLRTGVKYREDDEAWHDDIQELENKINELVEAVNELRKK